MKCKRNTSLNETYEFKDVNNNSSVMFVHANYEVIKSRSFYISYIIYKMHVMLCYVCKKKINVFYKNVAHI